MGVNGLNSLRRLVLCRLNRSLGFLQEIIPMSYLDLDYYNSRVESLRLSRHMDYPYLISIETLALCNAACNFCPYPQLERKGLSMSDELLWKIVHEFKDLPKDLPVTVVLSRVNETFLDKRVFAVAEWINRELPHWNFNFFSNASPLTPSNLTRLAAIRNINVLVLSVNDYRPEVYEAVMKLPFPRTLERVGDVHRLKQAGAIPFDVVLSRVGDGSDHDERFRAWVQQNYPLFQAWVTPRADWIGAVKTNVSPVPDVGCTQWFELHVLANGKEAFCCVDAEGRLGRGNAANQHIVEIYNQPYRKQIRLKIQSRLQLPYCQTCPLQA